MDQIYRDFQKRAKQLEYHVHDITDDHDHPEARVLRNEFRRLTEDFEQNKAPRSIEARMNTIQRQLMQVEHSNNRYMNINNAYNLHHDMQHMRDSVRKFPHY